MDWVNESCGYEDSSFLPGQRPGVCLAQAIGAIGLGWTNSKNIRANGPTICERSYIVLQSKLPGLWPCKIIVDVRIQAFDLG